MWKSENCLLSVEISFQNPSDNRGRPPARPTPPQPPISSTAPLIPLIHTNPTFLWRPFLTGGVGRERILPRKLTAEGSYLHVLREKGSVIKVTREKKKITVAVGRKNA